MFFLSLGGVSDTIEVIGTLQESLSKIEAEMDEITGGATTHVSDLLETVEAIESTSRISLDLGDEMLKVCHICGNIHDLGAHP